MSRLFFVTLLLTLTSTACAVGVAPKGPSISWTKPELIEKLEKPITRYVCLDLPKEQIDDAKLAVEYWDRALHQWLRLVPVEGKVEPCNYLVHEVLNDTRERDGSDSHALAWVSMIGGVDISMRKGKYERNTTGILTHELGHALGAQHVPNTLMNSTYNDRDFVCPDITTVAQVAAWNQIYLNYLCWCVVNHEIHE